MASRRMLQVMLCHLREVADYAGNNQLECECAVLRHTSATNLLLA